MTFYDKYPQLTQKDKLHQMVSENIYATMALEQQIVPMSDIEKIVTLAIEKEGLVHGILFFD